MTSIKLLTAILAVLLVTPAPAAIHAQSPAAHQAARQHAEQARENAQARIESARSQAQEKAETARQQGEAKLAEAKLRACENRQQALGRIMDSRINWGERHLEVFDTISERVQAFYFDHDLSAGNYDELVGNVEAKRAAAVAYLEEMKTSNSEFDCEGDSPKGEITAFRTSLTGLIAAMKDYRAAIRDLIVAVKSAQEADAAEETETNTEGGE